MKNLLTGMKRRSLGTEDAIAGRIDGTPRPRRTVRKVPRAHFALERLETRDLLTGVAPSPVSLAVPPHGSGQALPAASLVATAASPTEIDLAWSDLVNDQGSNPTGAWAVYSEPNGGVGFSAIYYQGVDPHTYDVTGLSPDSTYNFYVLLSGEENLNGTLISQTSNVASATTFLPLAGSPSLSATAASSTAVNLAWTGVSGAQQYTVSWWQTPYGAVQSTLVSHATTQLPVTGLLPNTSYSFQVTADDGVNSASQSNVQIVTTMPASPTLTAAPASSTQVNLSWSSVAGTMDYVIDNVVNGTNVSMGNAGTSTSYPLTGLNPYTNYNLEVGAIGPWGVSWSNVQSVKTLPTPLSLSGTAVSASQINLSWSSEAGANDYIIFELDDSTWTEFKDAGISTSFSATGLSANTTFAFKVCDLGPWGVNWSNVQSNVTFAAAPSAAASAVSASQINVGWNWVAGASSYQFDENVKGVWQPVTSFSASLNLAGVVVSAGGLSAGTAYQFRVGATNSSGTSWSNIVSALTFPAAPTASATTVSYSEIEVGWNPVAGASSYEVEENVSGAWQQVQPVVTGLLPRTTYEFRVGATNASGTSWSSVVSATTRSLVIRPVPETASGSSMMALARTSEPGAPGSASGTSSDIVIALIAGAPGSKRSNGVIVTT
jgi:Fibronectin type III domain